MSTSHLDDLPKLCFQPTEGRKCVRIRGHRGRHDHMRPSRRAQQDADDFRFALRLIAWGAKHDMPLRTIRAMANNALRRRVDRAEVAAEKFKETRK